MTTPSSTTTTALPAAGAYAGLAAAVLLAFGLLFAVAFDQGQLAQLAQAAAGDSTVHEVFHDARHMLGFPCH
ncbi:MAG: CbtB-domain containing protein [Frankiales bacterium]|nr:MAG: CbtB-domain containing protein [Frankiales bacterium]